MCFLNFLFYFSNFLYSTGGSHKRLGPGVIYLLLSISTGLDALIYALIREFSVFTAHAHDLTQIDDLKGHVS